MASQFCSRWFSGRQVEEISGMGRVSEVAVEPPLFEGIVHKWRYRTIVVRESLKRDVESPHCGCEYRYPDDAQVSDPAHSIDIMYDSDVRIRRCDKRKTQENRSNHHVGMRSCADAVVI
jgi:hypothetical protein